MSDIAIEQPPLDTDPPMSEYLVRQLTNINEALRATNRLPEINQLPAKPRDGELRYFGKAIAPDITAPGFWAYEEGAWKSLTLDSLVVKVLEATDDAGDGTVEGDFNATNFGQPLIEANTLLFVIHKLIQYAWVGPVNVTVGLGGSYTAVNDDFSPISTVSHSVLLDRDDADSHPQSAITGLVSDQATQDGRISANESKNVEQDGRLDVLEGERTRWRGQWLQGQTYLKNDMAIQGGWLGVVTAASTTDGPEPIPTGLEDWLIDLNGTWTPVRSTIAEESYITGNVYEFAQGLFITGYRIWLPENSENFQFQLWSVTDLGGANEQIRQIAVIPNGVATGQWLELGAGTLRIPPGTTLHMLKLTTASVQTEGFSAVWDVKNSGGNPGEGEANFQGSATEIRVHKTDDDDNDQTANLEAVEVGGTLSFAGLTWTINEVDIRGSHVRYHIEPNQGRPEENTQTLTFAWGAVEDIPFVTDTGYWAPVGPVGGVQGTTLRNLVRDNDAHGVDIFVRQVLTSDDWDIMAAP